MGQAFLRVFVSSHWVGSGWRGSLALNGPAHLGTWKTWAQLPPLAPLIPSSFQASRPRRRVRRPPPPAGTRGRTRDHGGGAGDRKGEGALPRAPDYFWLRSRGCLPPAARAHTHTDTQTRAHTRAHTHAHIFSIALSVLCLFSNLYFCLKSSSSLSPSSQHALSRAGRAHIASPHHPSPPPGLPELRV